MNPITFSERLNICLESDAALAATEAELSIAEYMADGRLSKIKFLHSFRQLSNSARKQCVVSNSSS